MVTEQTKKEKMRKTVNCSLMIAGLFFFLNPNYGVLDVLPDFIGAALLLLGFLHFADIDDRAQSAKKALLILAHAAWSAISRTIQTGKNRTSPLKIPANGP